MIQIFSQHIFDGSQLMNLPPTTTSQGSEIESVSQQKYLCILIDDSFSFKPNIQQLAKKLKRRLVAATFMSVMDYVEVLYMHASFQSLKLLDTVYHGALRFITNFRALTHHCSLYERVGWSALSTCRLNHWHILIYKAILGLLPPYLQTYYYCLSLKSELNWEKERLSMRPPALGISCKMS